MVSLATSAERKRMKNQAYNAKRKKKRLEKELESRNLYETRQQVMLPFSMQFEKIDVFIDFFVFMSQKSKCARKIGGCARKIEEKMTIFHLFLIFLYFFI